MVVTSYGRNKNRDDEIKKTEKANNSPSYRCAAIKQIFLDNRGKMPTTDKIQLVQYTIILKEQNLNEKNTETSI